MSNVDVVSSKVWRSALIALALAVVVDIFVFKSSFLGMLSIWSRSETFAHGFVVPPISLWLIWKKREIIFTQIPRPNIWFLIPLFFVVSVWFLADAVAVNSVTQLLAVASLVLLVPILLGYSIFRIILFPLCFLFFSVPLGEFLFPQLMEWTANFTVMALRFSGVPVYREGLQFVIPSGNWSVVEACSGIRYLIASLTVGTLFAYLNYSSIFRRLLFVLVSLVVPIFANWIRAYIIVILGHLSANRIATGVDHLIYGWVFFGLVISVMFLIGTRWSEPIFESGASPRVISSALREGNVAKIWLGLCITIVFLMFPIIWKERTELAHISDLNKAVNLSEINPAWIPRSGDGVEWVPAFKNFAFNLTEKFAKNGRDVDIFLGYYSNQSYGRKMVSSDNTLVTSNDPHWSKVASSSMSIDIGLNSKSVKTSVLRGVGFPGGEVRLTTWQFYWINGFVTSNDYIAIIYGAFQKILGFGDDSAVIILSTKYIDGLSEDALLGSFLNDNYSALNAILYKIKNN